MSIKDWLMIAVSVACAALWWVLLALALFAPLTPAAAATIKSPEMLKIAAITSALTLLPLPVPVPAHGGEVTKSIKPWVLTMQVWGGDVHGRDNTPARETWPQHFRNRTLCEAVLIDLDLDDANAAFSGANGGVWKFTGQCERK